MPLSSLVPSSENCDCRLIFLAASSIRFLSMMSPMFEVDGQAHDFHCSSPLGVVQAVSRHLHDVNDGLVQTVLALSCWHTWATSLRSFVSSAVIPATASPPRCRPWEGLAGGSRLGPLRGLEGPFVEVRAGPMDLLRFSSPASIFSREVGQGTQGRINAKAMTTLNGVCGNRPPCGQVGSISAKRRAAGKERQEGAQPTAQLIRLPWAAGGGQGLPLASPSRRG